MDLRLAQETVTRLLDLPSPLEHTDCWNDNAAYLDDCGFGQQDIAGLVSVLEAWVSDSEQAEDIFFDDDEGCTGITAWRLLAKLGAVEALPAMLRCLGQASGIDDDSLETCEEGDLPDALVLLGPEISDDLMAFAVDDGQAWQARSAVLESIRELGEQYPAIAPSLSPRIVAALENAAENHIFLNSALMGLALEWKLPAAAEAIERAFSINQIDIGYAGYWDEVRQRLGVQGLGLEMPNKPFNSIEDMRRSAGLGCFSKKLLFDMGELDELAASRYLDEAGNAFAASTEGTQVLGKHGQASNVHLFLDLGIQYLGVTVDTMTVSDAEEVLLDLFPRKVSMEAEHCGEVINELTAFWRFVDRVHDVEQASRIANAVAALSDQFCEAMTDPSNFGMAKSMFMMGEQAGFDMTSQEDLNHFMMTYNDSQLRADPPEPAVPSPLSAEEKRVDRKNRKKKLAAKTKSKRKC